MKLFFISLIFTIVGIFIGSTNMKHKCAELNLDEELADCQWEQSNCEHELDEQKIGKQKMIDTLLPNYLESE